MGLVMISGLADGTVPLDGTELIEIEQGGLSRKVSVSEIAGGAGGLFLPSCFYPGVPGDAAVLLYVPFSSAVTFAADFAGSYAEAITGATAETVFTVSKIVSGTPTTIGTITFAIGSTTGVLATTGGLEQSLAAGDILKITAQATADDTLADVGITLKGVR